MEPERHTPSAHRTGRFSIALPDPAPLSSVFSSGARRVAPVLRRAGALAIATRFDFTARVSISWFGARATITVRPPGLTGPHLRASREPGGELPAHALDVEDVVGGTTVA
ncbi:MAG TPA: hypothetical protein VGE74_02110, partial [Gemmata sp.]